MTKVKQVKDMTNYEMVDIDRDVQDSCEFIGFNNVDNDGYTKYDILYIKLDKSGADYKEVYGHSGIMPYLENPVYLIWKDHKVLEQ